MHEDDEPIWRRDDCLFTNTHVRARAQMRSPRARVESFRFDVYRRQIRIGIIMTIVINKSLIVPTVVFCVRILRVRVRFSITILFGGIESAGRVRQKSAGGLPGAGGTRAYTYDARVRSNSNGAPRIMYKRNVRMCMAVRLIRDRRNGIRLFDFLIAFSSTNEY